MTRTPEVRLDDDGRHVLWSHECKLPKTVGTGWEPDSDPSTWDYWHSDVRLPLHPTHGWSVVSTNPLTVSPSILCGACGTHGFWRDGRWISV